MEQDKIRAKLVSIQKTSLLAISNQLGIQNGEQLSQAELIDVMSEKIMSKLMARALSGSSSPEEAQSKIAKLTEHLLNAMDGKDTSSNKTGAKKSEEDPFLANLFYHDVSSCFVCGQSVANSLPDSILKCSRGCQAKCHESCHPWRPSELGLFECPACILLTMDPLHPVVSILYPPSFLQPSATYPLKVESLPDNTTAFEFRCLKLDGAHFTDTTLPDKGLLFFNGVQVKEFKPLGDNSSLKKRRDEKPILWSAEIPDPPECPAPPARVPADFEALFSKSGGTCKQIISENLSMFTSGGKEKSNHTHKHPPPTSASIKIDWEPVFGLKHTKTGAGDIRYVFCVVAIEKIPPDELIRRVRHRSCETQQISPIVFSEYSSQLVNEKFAQIEADKAARGSGEAEGETEQSSCKVNLKDMNTLDWMRSPGKGIHCTHLQTFCIQSFSVLMEKHHTRPWRCPICKGRANNLILDRTQDLILTEVRKRQREYNCAYLRDREVILELGSEAEGNRDSSNPRQASGRSRASSSSSVELVSLEPPKKKNNRRVGETGEKRGAFDQVSTAPSSPGDQNQQEHVLGLRQITGAVSSHSLITQKSGLETTSRERASAETDGHRGGSQRGVSRSNWQSAPKGPEVAGNLESQLQQLLRWQQPGEVQGGTKDSGKERSGKVGTERNSKIVCEGGISEDGGTTEGVFRVLGGPYLKFLETQVQSAVSRLTSDEEFLFRQTDYGEGVSSGDRPRGFLEWQQRLARRTQQERRLSEYVHELWVYAGKLRDIRLGKRTEEASQDRSWTDTHLSN